MLRDATTLFRFDSLDPEAVDLTEDLAPRTFNFPYASSDNDSICVLGVKIYLSRR